LLGDADRKFQGRVLYGPPPLGPGAAVIARLVAYGRARTGFLLEHHAIERAALDRNQRVAIPAGGMSTTHIRMLLGQARREGLLHAADIDSLAMQLAAALEGPFVMYLAPAEDAAPDSARREAALADSWESLVEHLLTSR
jgi:polyketide synthase 12